MPAPQPPQKPVGGRPRMWTGPTVKMALQLPEDLAKRLRTRAVLEGVTVSRFVGDLVVQRELEECIASGEADLAAGVVRAWEETDRLGS